MKDLPMIYVNKNRVWVKITFPRSDFSWSNRSFALTDFPDRPLFVSGQGKKKKITKAIPTPSLSHRSKDTVHIRFWTPESWVNLPSLPAESNLKLMCSNGTPVANKREKSREVQLTHERHNQKDEEDTGEKCKKSHSDL